jgi:hypothetical protein
MKSPLTAIVLSCCVASFHCPAEEPAPEGGVKEAPVFKEGPAFTLTAECQIVTLPQKAALKLLPDLLDEHKINTAYDRLQAMLAAGEAELVGNPVVKTQEGVKSESASADEFKYPTEWDPYEMPDPQKLPKADMVAIIKNWPIVGFQPTAFETRDMGAQLEFTPKSHSLDNRYFEVEVTAKDTRFLGWYHAPAGTTPTGMVLTVDQPHFYSLKSTSTLRLESGQRFLLGVHKVPDDKGLMEIFLLRVTGSKAP